MTRTRCCSPQTALASSVLLDVEEPWLSEARRYYIGIVGKYGAQVQAVLKKASALEIAKICPLHGPVLEGDLLAEALQAYSAWASYTPEQEGVLVAYSSVYGNTKAAAEQLAKKLQEKGQDVCVMDLARTDFSEAVAQAFRYSRLVLASITYNGDVFPHMRAFIEHLTERNYQNRTVGLMENGSWAPTAARIMTKMLESCKNLTIAEPVVSVKGAVNAANEAQMEALAEALS